MKIGFLVQDIVNLSGGSNVILEHASQLRRRGHQVTLITPEKIQLRYPLWHPRLAELRIIPLSAAQEEKFDALFATWWLTFFNLWKVESRIYGYFNQSLESRFHQEEHYKELNRLTYSLPLVFVAEAKWLVELIRTLQPKAPTFYVRNGLSPRLFPRQASVPRREGPLRVLVEGHWGTDFKGVAEAFELLRQVGDELEFETGWLTGRSEGAQPIVGGKPVTVYERVPIDQVHGVYREYDVLIKLSKVEGMFGPPLEMFSQGGTAITYAVTGSEEYMVHGYNSLLIEPYNRGQLGRYLKLLASSPETLLRLRQNALKTAREYPDWKVAGGEFAQAVEQLEKQRFTNAQLRPALEAISSLKDRWLTELWSRGVSGTPGLVGPPIGRGETVLLNRYRSLKSSAPVRFAQALVSSEVRSRARSFVTRLVR